LRSGGFESENFVGTGKGDAAQLGALEVAFEDEVRFVNLFEGVGLFADGSGEGVETGGSAFAFPCEGLKETFVHFVQPMLIDFEHFECGHCGGGGGGSLRAGEGVVTNPAEEVVGDAGRASAATGDFGGSGLLEFNFQEGGGASNDRSEIFDGIVVETVCDAEPRAEGGAE
jgi:hypothetical protein